MEQESQTINCCMYLQISKQNLNIFLIQIIEKMKNESEVAQSCPTLGNPMDCSLPGSSVHGIFQAIVLEWIAIERLNGILWQSSVRTLLFNARGMAFSP